MLSRRSGIPEYDAEQIRREMDEAQARAQAIVLAQKIDDLGNPFFDTAVELSSVEAVYDRWSMTSEPLLYARRKLVAWYAWAIPDERALELVGQTGSVVEIGAGGGYWAAMLRARGVEVFAYDPHQGVHDGFREKLWADVAPGHTKPVERHPGSTLFLCWPAYGSRYAEIAVRRYMRAGGKRVAYVGEHGGCCAEERFFALLDEQFEQSEIQGIPQFPGMHDYLTIWEPRS